MRLLLDTHTFIWWDSTPEKLSQRDLDLCRDPGNELYVSVASLWEIQIKRQLGKMRLEIPLAEMIDLQEQRNGINLQPVYAPHVLALDALPAIHKDPFDRMLVAQAQVEGMHLVSNDDILRKYPVPVEW